MKSIDEYAFHGSLLRVYEGLISFDVKKIFSHGFYSYGSTFFIINGLAAFPWLGETGSSFAIITPRLITTLFMAVTLFIMTKLVEQFHNNIFEKIVESEDNTSNDHFACSLLAVEREGASLEQGYQVQYAVFPDHP